MKTNEAVRFLNIISLPKIYGILYIITCMLAALPAPRICSYEGVEKDRKIPLNHPDH